MSRIYAFLAIVALAGFGWAQYNGYSLFDNVASGRSTSGSGVRSIHHK